MSRSDRKPLISKFPKNWTLTILFLTLTVGCSASVFHPRLQGAGVLGLTLPQRIQLPKFPNFFSNSCSSSDPFAASLQFAQRASHLTKSAKTKENWDEVAQLWVQAVGWMHAVPTNSPKRPFAEKKVREYMKQLTISQQNAIAPSPTTVTSFSNHLLDDQIQLYLSYIATVGVPDILIVGSSRALEGVDPKQLQISLARRGKPGLKIFNFGIHGATAQVVEFQLKKLLTPEQLPKMIIFADGVRAFNDGRTDYTYNWIINSEGTKKLTVGLRPKLPEKESQSKAPSYSFPDSCQMNLDQNVSSEVMEESESSGESLPADEPSIVENTSSPLPPDELRKRIDSNGFLSLTLRYNPETYQRVHPLVPGNYDRDYMDFRLGGKQERALGAIVSFTKARKIPLVLVNLPLTDDYLDRERLRIERKFKQRMEELAQEKGFIFRDLSQEWSKRNDYFLDPSHINYLGAKAVSERLASDSRLPWPNPSNR